MARQAIKKLNNNTNNDYLSKYNKFVLDKSVDVCKKTLDGYKCKILPFVNWLIDNKYMLTQDTMNEYILYLREKYPNATTVNTNLRAIKTFVRWLELDITIKVKKDKLEVKNLYTNEEIQILIARPKKNCTWAEFRDWAIICTLIGTGMRLGSLINIKVEDVDFNNEFITLTHTKNRKGQMMPISISLKRILLEYLSTWNNKPSDYFFPNQYGDQFVSVQSITKIVSRYNKRRGVNKTSSHLFRHTFAHNYIMQSGDIFRLSKLLGHSDIGITRIYSNIDNNDLKIDFNEMNLLDKSVRRKVGR